MGFIDEQRQKYMLRSRETSFLNYIFFRTIMIIGGAFSYKMAAFTDPLSPFLLITKTTFLPVF